MATRKGCSLKLGHTGSHDFALFESLELLALGVYGKLSLWKALQAAGAHDQRLHGYDFDQLIERARQQYEMVEQVRLELADSVFVPIPSELPQTPAAN